MQSAKNASGMGSMLTCFRVLGVNIRAESGKVEAYNLDAISCEGDSEQSRGVSLEELSNVLQLKIMFMCVERKPFKTGYVNLWKELL